MISDSYGCLRAHERWVAHAVDRFGLICLSTIVDLLSGHSIVLKRLDTMYPITCSVLPGKLLDLLVRLARNQLQLLWPDVSCPRQVQYFLPRRVDDHRGDLVPREALILEAAFLSDHLVEDFIALRRNLEGRLLCLADVFVMFTFEEHAVCQEHLDEVDWHHEAEVPFEELEQYALALNDFVVRGRLADLSQHAWLLLEVALQVVDEDELVVNLVVLRRDQEASRQVDGHNTWTH